MIRAGLGGGGGVSITSRLPSLLRSTYHEPDIVISSSYFSSLIILNLKQSKLNQNRGEVIRVPKGLELSEHEANAGADLIAMTNNIVFLSLLSCFSF